MPNEKKIQFQTPFPAKLRVFYTGKPLHSVEEVTTDMKERGLPIKVIKTKESFAEQLGRTRDWMQHQDLRARKQGSAIIRNKL